MKDDVLARVDPGAVVLVAPAKLTVSLEVVRRRPDGYHDIAAEMVTVDLFDRLFVEPGAEGMETVAAPGSRAEGLSPGPENLVSRALAAVGRTAAVRLEKRIPVGGGLGGGSADAGAILRWAGFDDLAAAAKLGGDVPFCMIGGRALVEGVGERVTPLPFEQRAFVLLVPPFGVDTAAVYERWDELAANTAGDVRRETAQANELTKAALDVEPRLSVWRDLLYEKSGRAPVLAGSGSTWFVEGTAAELGIADIDRIVWRRDEGRLIPVRTVPAGWPGPGPRGAPEE